MLFLVRGWLASACTAFYERRRILFLERELRFIAGRKQAAGNAETDEEVTGLGFHHLAERCGATLKRARGMPGGQCTRSLVRAW